MHQFMVYDGTLDGTGEINFLNHEAKRLLNHPFHHLGVFHLKTGLINRPCQYLLRQISSLIWFSKSFHFTWESTQPATFSMPSMF